MIEKLTRRGVVIEKDGKFWGRQYEDGRCVHMGWGPISKAGIHNPKYLKRPQDATYDTDHLGKKELGKGRLIEVVLVTTWELKEL